MLLVGTNYMQGMNNSYCACNPLIEKSIGWQFSGTVFRKQFIFFCLGIVDNHLLRERLLWTLQPVKQSRIRTKVKGSWSTRILEKLSPYHLAPIPIHPQPNPSPYQLTNIVYTLHDKSPIIIYWIVMEGNVLASPVKLCWYSILKKWVG